MKLTVQGKQMNLGDALQTHVTEKLEELNQKYFNHAISATVTFSPDAHAFTRVQISLRIGKEIMVQAQATEKDPYNTFDAAAEKIAKQLRRYKKRLRDHHERLESVPGEAGMKARDYVLASTDDDAEEDANAVHGEDPVVIAEMSTNIQTMTVSEAVMRMDLAEQSALLFRNAKHNGLNMVYRRADGNIGWIDPEESQEAAA